MAVKDFRDFMRELKVRDPSTDVYVTLWRGDRYHSKDCGLLAESVSPQIRRITLALAKSLEYKPCEICKSDARLENIR